MYESAVDRQLEPVDVVVSPTDQTEFSTIAKQFLKLRAHAKALKTKQSELHCRVMEFIEEFGYDKEGSQVLELPDALDGITKMVRQRKTSKSFDQEEAERRLRGVGLFDRCTKEVRVLDSDEIMSCLYDGLLTEDDIEAIFPIKETYSLVPR